jgi:D-galactarolactone cycloisomerase
MRSTVGNVSVTTASVSVVAHARGAGAKAFVRRGRVKRGFADPAGMRVTDVEAVPLRRDLDERIAIAQKWISSREYCLVRVETDEGVTGWGECWGPIAGNRETVEEYVAPWLEGREVAHLERVHDDLVFELTGSYHSYTPASVVSGVDIALHDALGKARGVPASALLGGRRRDSVRAYATGHFWTETDDFETLRDRVVAEAEAHVDAGFDALKNKIGFGRHPDFPWGWREDVSLVRAIREAVGDDVRLMTDANHAYDLATAGRVGRALADLDVYWFEEPVRPHAIAGYEHLHATLDVPLAAGECWAFEHEFARALDAPAVGVTQPDVTSAGGLTSTRRVATLSDTHNVQCVPHVFGSAVALAASLQALATVPGRPMLEFDRTPNPIREGLAVDPVTNEGNTVAIPDAPGIGVEVDPDVLESFRVD